MISKPIEQVTKDDSCRSERRKEKEDVLKPEGIREVVE